MGKTALKVILADAVLLTGLYLVVKDLEWRSSYAASAHNACEGPCSYTPSLSHSILTQFFTMTGNGVSLTSPPTLDWVQLLVVILVVVNVWYGYSFLETRKAAKAKDTTPVAAAPIG